MSALRAGIAAVTVALLAPTVYGQGDAKAPPHQLPRAELDPDVVRRVAERLRIGDAAINPSTGAILQDVLEAMRRNPGKNIQEIAREFVNDPRLRDPEKLRELARLVRPQAPPDIWPEGIPFRPPVVAPPSIPPPVPPSRLPNQVPGGRPIPLPPSGRPPIPSNQSNQSVHTGVARPGKEGGQPDARQRQFDIVRAFWERNVGPLDRTPAVRDLLREMFVGPNGLDRATAAGLASLLSDSGPEANGLTNWMTERTDLLGSVELPSFGLTLGDFTLPAIDPPTFDVPAPSGLGVGGFSGRIPEGASWLSMVLFVLVAAGALVLWRYWPQLFDPESRGPMPLPGLGPWPVDPRSISDRDGLIRAFEYLSVLLCGAAAKSWNHSAIAEGLRSATGAGESADVLARIYALARYSPNGELISPEAVAEARRHLCHMAGVSAP